MHDVEDEEWQMLNSYQVQVFIQFQSYEVNVLFFYVFILFSDKSFNPVMENYSNN